MIKYPNTALFKYSIWTVFGLLETPAEVSGQGYEASSDTTSAQRHCASVSSNSSLNRASTSADLSRLGYFISSCRNLHFHTVYL